MKLFSRNCGDAHEGGAAEEAGSRPIKPSPDHAWKALTITNEWIRHADAKTGITLAFVGATATALFNVAHALERWTCLLTVTVTLGVVTLLTAIASAGLALLPRVRRHAPKGAAEESVEPEDAVSLLFFGDVTMHYGADRPTFREVFATLTSDPTRLTRQIADQIHANAHVATTKFTWANRAIKFELASAVCLAVTALLYATGW